jgi:hypothetical protein
MTMMNGQASSQSLTIARMTNIGKAGPTKTNNQVVKAHLRQHLLVDGLSGNEDLLGAM